MKKREIDFAFGSNLISFVFEQESFKRLLKNEHAQILYCQLEIEKGGDALSKKLYVGHISSTRFAFN
jgi:hypothetical protein